MIKKLSVLLAVIFLFSCAQIVRNPVKYDQQVFINHYEKMFSAAMNQGTRMSYKIDYQNREYGLLKMSRKVGVSTYRITVKFDDDNFTIKGDIDTDIFNPFIGEDAKIIEEAIKNAVK
jgi:hypothetical protein